MRRFALILAAVTLAECGGGAASNQTAPPNVSFPDDTDLEKTGQDCLNQISGFGGYGAQLVASLSSIPITVKRGSGASATVYSAPEKPVTIEWSPMQGGNYPCSGAPRQTCATLLHELAHAQEYWNGTASQFPLPDAMDEWNSVRAENWLLQKLGLCQRDCYDGEPPVTFPSNANVKWSLDDGQIQVRASDGAGGMLCAIEPTTLSLTVTNQSPDQILVSGGSDNALLCGGQNTYFRASTTTRNCMLSIANNPENNPFAVPLTTLVAYFPSGDPNFTGGGHIEWSNESGADESCGGNAYSEYCQIAFGQNGQITMPPLTLAMPMSRMVTVKYVTGGP